MSSVASQWMAELPPVEEDLAMTAMVLLSSQISSLLTSYRKQTLIAKADTGRMKLRNFLELML